MKCAVYDGYGDAGVIRIRDVPQPVPKEDEVLIRMRAASIDAPDWRIMHGKPAILRLLIGVRKPRFKPGRNIAGDVAAVGIKVSRFKPGDAVFGTCSGAFAEYGCARESRLVRKPENVTYEQGAATPISGLTALQGLRDYGKVRAGQTVLINGASGGVGTFAVQIAKYFGASVTGVCSTDKVEMVRSIGADRVIDYTQQDFAQERNGYDVLFDLIGDRPLAELGTLLNPNGRYVAGGAPKNITISGMLSRVLAMIVRSRLDRRTFTMFIAKSSQADLDVLAELLAAGKLVPVIDRRYGLADTSAALAYVDQGHARAKVVIIP